MPIRIDPKTAEEVLARALAVARSSAPLPRTWIDLTKTVGGAASKTNTAALGTALLARATDARIDPMSIKATPNRPYAYSARSLCHGVLVPAAREHGFDLGATGREPLNNQPFFRYERMDEMGRVRDQAGLAQLLTALRAVAHLTQRQAQRALAAYLRVRLEAAASRSRIDLRGTQVGVNALIEAITDFVTENPEGGKRGQALVAGVFDAAFESVRMGRVNDPSRRLPGDVQAMDGVEVTVAAEVRQKLVLLDDVIAYARVLSQAGVANGLVVALHPDQEVLDRDEVLRRCEAEHGVHMAIIDTVAELVSDALTWAGRRVDAVLAELPDLVVRRLEEIEVAPATLARWAELLP